MPRFPLDRRERSEQGKSMEVLLMARNNDLNSFMHGMPMNHAPFCDSFAGRECSFVFDDCTIQYTFGTRII